MRKIVFVLYFFISATVLLCFYGTAAAEPKGTGFELGIGAGVNMHGFETRQVLLSPALSVPISRRIFRLRVEGNLEYIDADGRVMLLGGIAPFIRASLPEEGVKLFVEAGGGLNIANRQDFAGRQLGGPFFFSAMVGAGIEIPWGPKVLSISYRLRHISNGHLRSSNQGFNSQYFMLSMGF